MTRVARDCLCRDVWGERVLREPLPRCTIRILADQGASLGRWTALAARRDLFSGGTGSKIGWKRSILDQNTSGKDFRGVWNGNVPQNGCAAPADLKVSSDPFDFLLRLRRSIDEYRTGTKNKDRAGGRSALPCGSTRVSLDVAG